MGEKILLSVLVNEFNFNEYTVKFVNEKPFKYFARATSKIDESKCLFVGDAKYAIQIDDNTDMVITTEEVYEKIKDFHCGFCITEKPRNVFFNLMNEYEQKYRREQFPTIYGENVSLGKYVSISEYNVKIGSNVVIEDFVQIMPNVSIGDNTIIRAGSKIGVHTFNLYREFGITKQMYHAGQTVIGKNVLIGHNNVIEQAIYRYGVTRISDNCMLDANVLIGHNDELAECCTVTAGTCIAGYVTVGSNTVIRLGVSIKNGISIGENSHIGMGSVVVRKVRPNSRMFGNPAVDLTRGGLLTGF